jgi:hypothetical protein
MHKTTSITAVVAILSLGHFASGAETGKPNFNGTWKLDAKKSEGMPEGTTQVLTVKQVGDRIDVEIKMSGPQGDRTLPDAYVLDGKETEFRPAIVSGGNAKAGTRVSTWAKDGLGFDAQEQAVIDGPEGADEVKGKRTWRLSPDGKVLTIEMDMTGKSGAIKSKRVFNIENRASAFLFIFPLAKHDRLNELMVRNLVVAVFYGRSSTSYLHPLRRMRET